MKKYENETFNPTIKEKYRNGRLNGINLYKSEGILGYSITEINNDLPLKKLLKLKDNKKIQIIKDKIINEGKVYTISTILDDSIFCSSKDLLVIFIYK